MRETDIKNCAVWDSTGGGIDKDYGDWESNDIVLTDAQKADANIVINMPDNDVVIEAIYNDKGRNLKVQHGFFNGDTSVNDKDIKPREKVALYADDSTVNAIAPEFRRWLVISGDLSLTEEQMESSILDITMPNSDVVIYAEFDSETDKHLVYVENGTVDGLECMDYYPGDTVTIKADSIQNKEFECWLFTMDLSEYDETSKTLTFKMPDCDVYFYGKFKDVPKPPYKPPKTGIK